MRSGNPALRPELFDRPVNAPNWADLATDSNSSGKVDASAREGTMTVTGTAMKTGFLIAICAASAVWAWGHFLPAVTGGTVSAGRANPAAIMPWFFGTMIAGLVLSLIGCFAPRSTIIVGPLYAAVQGIFLSLLSMFVSIQFLKGVDLGLIFQAITLTFAIGLAGVGAFALGLIRIGGMVSKIMSVAMIGLVLYALALLLSNGFFNLGLPNLWSSASPMGIAFSGFVVILAAFNLIEDIQMVDEGVQNGAPKHMEWYSAFALTVTLLWLYIEVLRLLAKLRSNNN